MKKVLLLFAAVVSVGTFARAADAPQNGTLVSENSVSCGSKGSRGKKSMDILCQEYVVRSGSTEYHIRQEKPGDKALLPINAAVEFTISKDKMKFKADGKSYEYLVVSESAAARP
jgi:hypothetical protein